MKQEAEIQNSATNPKEPACLSCEDFPPQTAVFLHYIKLNGLLGTRWERKETWFLVLSADLQIHTWIIRGDHVEWRYLKSWECFYFELCFSKVTSLLVELTFTWEPAVGISAHEWNCFCLVCFKRKGDSHFVFQNNTNDMLFWVEHLTTGHFSSL